LVQYNINISSTLTILRLLEGLISLSASTVPLKTFGLLVWALSCRQSGAGALQVLGLSPIAGFPGTVALALSKNISWMDRVAAITRVSFLNAIWVSGVVLFTKTLDLLILQHAKTLLLFLRSLHI